MDPLQELVDWATERGIKLRGIAPQRMPGKGIGMVATEPLAADQTVLETPTSALCAVTPGRGVPASASLSAHGLLAAELALSPPSPWTAVCPTIGEVETWWPITWAPGLQRLLPGAAQRLLSSQRQRLSRDWASTRDACAPAGMELQARAYRRAWLLVNSRTFHAASVPGRMALRPVADLFNHANDRDDACAVTLCGRRSDVCLSVSTRRAYRAGEELCIAYGAHANDALLVEYGFVPPAGSNPWDEVELDDVLLPALTPRSRCVLAEAGFLGGYVLDARDVCWRTQVAVRAMCLPEDEYLAFARSGGDGGADAARTQWLVDGLLVGLLRTFREDTVAMTIRALEALEEGTPVQRDVLARRWRQIDDLVAKTIERLNC